MPAFLVTLPVSGGKTLIGAANSFVVFALDATDARAVCANHVSGDSDALWNSADTTVEEIVVGTTLPEDYELEFLITNDGAGAGIATPVVFRARGGAGNVAFDSVAIGDTAGALYVDDEIVTISGGVFTRAATVRCEGTGAVTAVDLIDPGEYTVLPTLDEMASVADLSGDNNLTLDGVAAEENSYEVLLGQMVTLLNANSEIAGASVDMSELLTGTRLFTLADGGGGDDLGDSTVLVRLGSPHKGDIPGLLGAVTHEGADTAVLSVALPAIGATTFVMPVVLATLKT